MPLHIHSIFTILISLPFTIFFLVSESKNYDITVTPPRNQQLSYNRAVTASVV
jgi:hypothetical protein